MAVIVAAATGVAVRARTLRMPPPAGLRPVVLRSITLMGHHTRPIVPTGAAAGVKTSTGGLRPCVGSRSSPAPGCHLVWARSQSGGTLGRLCAAPHLEAPHDPRRRLETGERRGSSSTTAQPAPRSRRPGAVAGVGRVPARHTGHFSDQRIRAEGQAPRWPRPTDPGAGVAASGYGAGAHCVEVWGRGVLRRGVGQRGAASGYGAGAHCVEVWGRGVLRRGVAQRGAASGCGAEGCCLGVWGRGLLRRGVAQGGVASKCGARHRGPMLPFDSPGRACGAARVGLRWMWGRTGGAALDVGPPGGKCAGRGAALDVGPPGWGCAGRGPPGWGCAGCGAARVEVRLAWGWRCRDVGQVGAPRVAGRVESGPSSPTSCTTHVPKDAASRPPERTPRPAAWADPAQTPRVRQGRAHARP